MDRIRYARRRLGLSQEELAEASGVSAATIVQVELGHRRPQGRTLRKLAAALGVEVADLLEEETRPKAGSPLSAERALEIADPDVFRRVVKETPAAELQQASLELANFTTPQTHEVLIRNKNNPSSREESHRRVAANHRILIINEELVDKRGVRPFVELVARRSNDALTPPKEPQEARENAG